MKKILYNILIVLFITPIIISCDLNMLPESAIEVGEGYKTIDDASKLRRGLYSYFRNANYGTSMLFADAQADILNTTGSQYQDLYQWLPTMSENYDIRDFWSRQFGAISQVNAFLDNVDKIEVESNEDRQLLNGYKGEALLMRAVFYYNLAIRYMKDYEPETSTKDLGLPLYLTYDPGAKLARSTMEETWQQIYKDVNEAIALLPKGGKAMSQWITGDYAYAVKARVALIMHKWDDAINATDVIIPRYALASSVDDLINLWIHDDSSEIILKLFISINEGRKSGMDYIGFGSTSRRYFPTLIPAQWTLDQYENDDYRRAVYFQKQDIWVSNVKFPNVWLFNKGAGNPIYNTKPNIPSYVNAPKLFMIAEAYLIKAEALARKGKNNESIDVLNALRKARGASMLPKGGNALEDVKKERTREMIAEGGRLFDLKRWHMGFSRNSVQPAVEDAVLKTPNTVELSKKADDKMFVWEIPINDLQTNDKLVPNW